MARPKVLFIRLGAIGDVVRTLPALRLVRDRFPGAYVAWVVENRSLPLVQSNPDLDEVLLLERDALAQEMRSLRSLHAGLGRAGRFARELRRRRFTVSLDFQGTFKSGLIARLSGAARRIGYEKRAVKEANHLFNNVRVPQPVQPVNRVERNLDLLSALGIERSSGPVPVTLPIGDDHRAAADGILRASGVSDGPFVFLYPGSSKRQSYKRYPAARFALVAERLLAAGVVTVVGQGAGEEDVVRTFGTAGSPAIRVLPPMSLLAMAEVIRRSRVFIGGDTGPMHLAWIQGVPVVALFGPTDPAVNAPWGRGHVVLDAFPRRPGGRSRADAAGGGPTTGRVMQTEDPAASRRPRDPSVFDALAPDEIADAAMALYTAGPRSGSGLSPRSSSCARPTTVRAS